MDRLVLHPFRSLFILGMFFAGLASAALDEGSTVYDEKEALAKSQAVLGQETGNHTFHDGNGRQVTLDALRGKPVVISLIYTSCYHICPTVTTNLAKVVTIARDALGDDSFSVLSIGFDTPVDTPDRMRVFAAQRNIDIDNWYFVSADAESMESLANDVGFSYFKTPKGFDHIIQATVLDSEGKVYRQIYGMAPEPPALVEPLKEILWGKQVATTPIESMLNNIRLFCTVYDPTTGMYRFDYSIFIGAFMGLLALGGTAWFIVRAWRKSTPARPLT
ncbi:MAG: SCO family protein [Gammaproteobacteria bacterium]|nr:MAG: SCO family protein [Gammaproteobacteria bacterium]